MSRFEPSPRDPGIGDGLAARVHDPLWLLARQWQLGEFRGEDGGTPCDVDVDVELHPLDEWRPAGEGEPDRRPYDPAAEPLERLVEQEGPPPAEDPRLRAVGGERFTRMLGHVGLAGKVPLFVARYGFRPGPGVLPARGLAATVRRRVPDGALLAPGLRRLRSPETGAAEAGDIGLTAEEAATAAEVGGRWLTWWDPRVPEVQPGADLASTRPQAWDENRMEHAFAVRSTTRGDVELVASEYCGGSLDWWAFDAVAPPEPSDVSEPVSRSFGGVPAPARFGGMPAPRFWEMEDARFDPGSVDAAPTGLGRLLLVGYASVYGNDWFVVPLRMDAGSLVRIRSMRVTDVFGEVRELGRVGEGEQGWSMYALGDHREVDGASPYFLLAPRLPGSLESPQVEAVLLARDEMANLAWAIEQRVVDEAGEPRERFDEWVARELPARVPGPVPRYLVVGDVPDHWFPLAPEQLDDESVRLRLLPLSRMTADAGPRQLLPLGALLAGATRGDELPLWLHEEEVPRSGASVTRTHQRARWHGGSVHAWTGRRKGSGTGESSSGLRYDSLEEGR